MSRPLRIQYENAYYHVMNRGIAGAEVFRGRSDYEAFIELLKEAVQFYDIKVIAYCLMPNHYHLLIQTPDANLSRVMRHIVGVYVQRFNRSHKKDGPLFRGRYKAILVEKDDYMRQLVRYIHLNPIEAKCAKDPADYKWSSHSEYLNAGNHSSSPSWVSTGDMLSFFAPSHAMAMAAYKEFIAEGVDENTRKFFSRKNQASFFGSKDFIKIVKEKYVGDDMGRDFMEIPEGRALKGEQALNRIGELISEKFDVPKSHLRKSRRGKVNEPRAFAIALAKEFSGLSHEEIAEYFNAGSYKNISAHYRRLMQTINNDKDIANRYEGVKSLLDHISKSAPLKKEHTLTEATHENPKPSKT